VSFSIWVAYWKGAYFMGGVGVKARGGLIQEKHPWMGNERNTNVCPLGLPMCTETASQLPAQPSPGHESTENLNCDAFSFVLTLAILKAG